MKGIYCIVVLTLLLITSSASYPTRHSMEIVISFEKPEIIQDEYTAIIMNNSHYLHIAGNPILPYKTKVVMFPWGTKIDKIEIKTSKEKIMKVESKITPAPAPATMEKWIADVHEGDVYSSNELYPSAWAKWHIGVGRIGDEINIIVSFQFYPVRYVPSENEIHYIDSVKVKIFYTIEEIALKDVYDLLIVSPSEFKEELQALKEHKEKYGIKTKIVTTDEIYNSYYFPCNGRDDAEKIKYFIKNAIEEWGIKYVLLVGGMKSLIYAPPRDNLNEGSKGWYLPVRYTNLYEMGRLYDPGFISDLYYADIYKYENGIAFEDWDSNGNGIFAEWNIKGRDKIDLYPDVYVGRIACRNVKEVEIIVKKIIGYESKPSLSWFKKFVLIGGDTFDDVSTTNYYEGEVANQKALEYMEGFEGIKVWASNRNTGKPVPEPKDIIEAISNGCGFLYFAGHGSPCRWNTYWPEAFDEPRCGGLWLYHMPFISNEDMLPVCVVGGCHNSEFNVTTLSFIFYWLYGSFPKSAWVYIPTPECWSWWLTRKIGGGSIATIGNTGLGYGAVGDYNKDGVPDCIQYYGGFIETQFFKEYGQNKTDILGETWGKTIISYLNTYPGMDDRIDCKTVEQWVLLGDPSLKIGGYG